MNRSASHLSFALALLLASPSVFAQGAAPPPAPAPAGFPITPPGGALPSAAPLAESLTGPAKADYDAGAMLYRDRDFAGALVKFQSAYDASRDPRLLFNLGACEKNLRHYAKTIAYFERYRAEAGTSLTPADRDQVDRLLDELRPFVSNLNVTANEPGATIYVDDASVGTTPLAAPLHVDIGIRRVRLTKQGFTDYAHDLNVTGSDVAVTATLERIVHEGRLVVHASAPDAIAVDGTVVGTAQLDVPLASGGHQLRVTAPGMLPFQTEVLVNDKETRTIDVTLDPEKSGGVPAWVWVAGGILIAGGVTTGAYFALKPGTTTVAPPAGTMGIATTSFR